MIAGIFGGKKPRRIGIVGGLGPETSCKFCLNLNTKFRSITCCQPDIVLENLPVPSDVESKAINGENSEEMLELLSTAVKRLNRNEVDFIVIPCNTVHVFIDELRRISKKPILSIIEECAEECRKRNFARVGILATTKSVKENLHKKELEKRNIKTITPGKVQQEKVSRIIIRIIHNKTKTNDKQKLLEVIKKLKAKGAEAVILGCTDLFLLVLEKDSALPLINTTSVLEESSVNMLINSAPHSLMEEQSAVTRRAPVQLRLRGLGC